MDGSNLPSEQEWRAFKAELEGVRLGIHNRLVALCPAYLERRPFEERQRQLICGARDAFCVSIGEQQGYAQDYLAYHIVIGSTVDYADAPKLDFPEPYSLKSLFERMAAGTEPGFEVLALGATRPQTTVDAPSRDPT